MLNRLLIIFALCFWASGVAAGQLVVLESSSDNYPVGTLVDSSDIVSLGQGERLSLLSEDGGSIVAAGPMENRLGVEDHSGTWSNGIAKISSFLSKRQASRSKLGAVRAFASEEPIPSGAINVTQDGVYCFQESTSFRFWRPATHSGDSNFSLRFLSTGRELSGFWVGDDRYMGWPPGFDIPYGSPFELTLGAYDTFAEVRIIKIPSNVVSAEDTLVWMIEMGCDQQVVKWLGVD